jgi:hypothetical protein
MEFEWPYCATCGKGAERVDKHVDPFSGDVLYTVYCHGATETQVVRGMDIHDATLLSRI